MDWEVRAVSLILCLGILFATIENGMAERRIVCYYTNWSVYRPGTAKFSPQNINPYLCTHLIYAFGGFTKENALKPFDKYQDIEKGGYAKFTGLKTYNKNLKTMLAIGGWNEGSSRFSPMVADPARRREFVKNAIRFLRQNHFDGLDLDWEYPAFRDGGKPRDKDNYANLVQELREEFERESSKTGRSRLLLSMAMPAGIEYMDKGYDVHRLNEYLDFINLLSYDYHSAYEPAVNHHSPLYPLEEDNEYNYDAELTIDYTINHLLEKGASASKIVLGIPTYGRSYTLFNKDATDLGSPADGPGVEGEATREKGYLAYYEICESIAESDEWEVVEPNPKAMGPYAFKGDQWVGYDDEGIVRLKARYVNEKKLGGIMFWSIDNDDFRGKCHNRPYPLIEAAKEALLTDNRSTIDKTKSTDNRKKSRTQGTSSNARKLSTNGRRSSTTSAPITSKRVSSSRPKYRTISRPRTSNEEQEDREVSRRSYDRSSDEDIEGGNTVRVTEKIERPKNRSRGKTRTSSTDHNSRRKQTRRKGQTKVDENEESLSNKLTTPQPPTTPDPGTDFKCEDEGFFPHPRDCKKYFWCLDSGPGGLGVVAHQFTCPSGLVFNKAADSCDYPRNVICPKTSKTSVVSTTRSPITAATSRTTYLHSTTTAKAESIEEYEDSEEDYDEHEIEETEEEVEEVREEPIITTTAKPLVYKTLTRNRPSTATTVTSTTLKRSESQRGSDTEDEEDPKVIKELIDLIKKAGGIEQLEKQLLLQEKNSDATSLAGSVSVTPAAISRSLYERVLNRQTNRIGSQRPILSSSEISYVNGPGRAQFEGLDDIPEVKSLRRSQKPQYVTIERPKSAKKEPPSEDENIDENEENNDNTDVASSEEESISNPLESSSSTQRVTPNYVNIRRTRLSTTTSRNENDVGGKEAEIEEERSNHRRRPFLHSKQQDNDPSSQETFNQRNRGLNFRNSDKRADLEGADQSAEKDDDSLTTKSRYVSIQRFRSTTSKTSEDSPSAVPSSELTSETTLPFRAEEYPEVATNSTVNSATLSSTMPTSTTSTSTEIITVISVEPPENPFNVSPKVDTIDSTTDSMKLVEDSATEILLTTVPAASSSSQTATTTTTTTLASRSTIAAAVSQPRPFGFTRRRSSSSEAAITTTSPSRPKVADSQAIRLPTLRELIGYPMTYYDDRTATTLSSVLLHLLRNDVDNDISRDNVVDESRDIEKDFTRSPRNRADEIGDDSWLQQASESKAISRSPNGKDEKITLEERTLVTNSHATQENGEKKSSTRISDPRPTTMRGIPLASLTPSSQMHGFYVTRRENGHREWLSTASTLPIPANDSTVRYSTVTTYRSTERQRTEETTLIPDVSTTDDIVAVASGNGQHETIRSTNVANNNDANSIINGQVISNLEGEDFFISTSSELPLRDSDSADNLSDYREIDAVTTLARPAVPKRGKSLRNFDYDTISPRNAHVISSTTPTRRKIALAVSRYNDATTPLWTGKRIVVRKRNRSTVSPIKEAIRRTESDFTQTTTSAFENAFATTVPTSSTSTISTMRKLFTTMTSLTVPAIASESTVASEALYVHRDFASFTDRPVQHLEKHGTTTETTINVTDPIQTTFPISKLTSTANAGAVNDATTVVRLSTLMDDSTIVTIPTIVANASIITTTSSTSTVAEAAAATIDAAITTTPSTSAITGTEVETVSEISNYSAITLPITAKINSIANEYATTTTTTTATPIAASIEIDSQTVPTRAIANYSVITMNPIIVNPYEFASDSATESTSTAVKTTYTTANYPALAIPANTHARVATATVPVIHTLPLTAIITSTTDNLRINTTTTASMTTRDLRVDANTMDVTTDTINTITSATVINSTIIRPNPNANLSLAVTSATIDTLTIDVTKINSTTFKPAVISTDATLATLTSLAFPDQVSSTESSTIRPSTALDLLAVLDIGGKDLDRLTVPATTESIGTTEFTTMFESPIDSTTLTLTTPASTISQSLSDSNPATSVIVRAKFPIQTDDSLTLTTLTDAQTLPILSSTAIPTPADSATYRPSIVIDTVIPSITSGLDKFVQTTDKKAILSEMNVERDFKETVISTIAQNQTENRQIININETNSLQMERMTPETKTTFDKVASKNAQTRVGNRTVTELDTNDHVLGRKTSRRRVLNRTNNWIGRPVAQQSINHYPRRRVTVVYRHRGQPRKSFVDYSSPLKVMEENRKRRIVQKRRRINSEAISKTVRSANISEERTVHDSAKNVTRKTKIVLKRVREKNTTTLPVEETTTVSAQSSTYTDNENKTKLVGRRRQVVVKRLKLQSGEDSTAGEIAANSADENLSDRPQDNFPRDEAFIREQKKTGRRMRLVLKSIRPKSEEKNMTEQASANFADHDKSFRNNLSNDDNLSDKANRMRKRMRVVLKSVRPKSNERNVTIEEANVNFRFHSMPSNEHLTQDDPSDSFRTSENLERITEGKTRRRMRVAVSKRVKPKFKDEKAVAEKADASISSAMSNREGKNLSLQQEETRRRTKVILKSIESKSEFETNSTKQTSERLLDEEGAREQMGVATTTSNNVKSKLSMEEDSTAEETNTDFNFVIKEPRITFPFNFSNNLRTMIKQSEGFDAELHTESAARIEEETDRLSLEVNPSNNSGSVSRKTGNGYANRHRKPIQSTTTVASPITPPNTVPNTHRRGTTFEITVSPKIEFVDAFEGTEGYAKQTAAENDQKTDVSDQSIRAQEFAVTVADPPFSPSSSSSSSSSSDTGRTPLRDAVWRKINTTVAPRTNSTTGRTISRYDASLRNRPRSRTKNRPTVNATARPRRPPVIDYDYYEDQVPIVIGKSALNSKLFLTSKGTIRCLDQGNFPHPYSCKKFITCARMVNGQVIGTEYTCPDKLSFDPVGGICNWSAGLGCKD